MVLRKGTKGMKEVNYTRESRNFAVSANGAEKKVYDTQVLLEVMNVTKHIYHPFYSSFAIVQANDSAEIDIECKFADEIKDVKLAPKSRNYTFRQEGKSIKVRALPGDKLCVTVNGEQNRMLMIFVQEEVPVPEGDVIYFGAGEHFVDDNENNELVLKSGQTLYLDDGAVLHGKVTATNCRDIAVMGNGIICGTHHYGKCPDYLRGKMNVPEDLPQRRGLMQFVGCENVRLQNISIIDSDGWNVTLSDCQGVAIDKINIVGYRFNSDGIDICSSQNVTVSGAFIRTSDDCVVIKSLKNMPECREVTVSDCVFWGDRANPLEIGHEVAGGDIHDICFKNIDILNQIEDTYGYHAIDIANVDSGDVYNVLYEDIRVEECVRAIGIRIREGVFSLAETKGQKGGVHDIRFKNISIAGKKAIVLSGRDEEHKLKNITFENVTMDGKMLSEEDFYRNPFTENVKIKTDGVEVDAFEEYPSEKECVPLDIRNMCNLLLEDGWGIYGLLSEDWFGLPSGVHTWEGIPFNITGQGRAPGGDYKLAAVPAERMYIPVSPELCTDFCANRLFFLHTAVNVIGNTGKRLGSYVITYEDGTQEEAVINNRNDCDDWKCWSTGGWQPVYKSIRMYVMHWKNPNPEKKITKIRLEDSELHAMPVLLGITRA